MAKLRVDKIAAPIVKDEYTGSVYFDGTGDYLQLDGSSDFAFGTGDFNIELWVYIVDSSHTNTLYDSRPSGSNGNQVALFYSGSSNVVLLANNGTVRITGTVDIGDSKWHHISLSRQNGVTKLYVDGVQDGSYTDSTNYENPAQRPFIGASGGSTNLQSGTFTEGYISNLRVCKGHAVYTENFTPPTRELEVHTGAKGVVFPAADNRTVLLACQSSTDVTAEATGRHTITAAGNAHAQSANPGLLRKTNTTSTITETTGSVFFDGSGDYLSLAPSTDFSFSNDFTVEAWAYPTDITSDGSNSKYKAIFSLNVDGGWNAQGNGLVLSIGNLHYGVGYNTDYNNGIIPINTWTHLAVTRSDGAIKIFVNGILDQTINDSNSDDTFANGTGNIPAIGLFDKNGGTPRFYFTGYISNLRVCKGHAVYTSNFIPPTRELEVHEGPDDDRTVLLACYDGENIFADKTGRHIIAAHGDRTSSPTPTATDSPIGITTFNPGLTREVDPLEGPTFGGGAGFVSQNWLTLPKGTTAERMPSFGGVTVGTRGFFAGAYSPTRSDVINYVTVSTLGNAIDFGNLGAANGGPTGFSDSTRGWIAGGNISPTITNVMEYVTMASSGNAVDGGDLIIATGARPGSVANSIRGIVAGGNNPSQTKHIVHHTIQTTGIVQDFGDLTENKSGVSGVMSPTRGVFAGGNTPSGRIDTIEHITIASTGNAVLFGELSLDDRSNMGGASNTVRGLYGGGRSPTDHAHIEYITIATLGDAVDFGDLAQSNMDGDVGAVSNSTRVVFGGGASDELGHVEIATLGNTTQFGKFTVNTTANQDPACFSSGHGGLG